MVDIKRKFERGVKKSIKVAELWKLEQGNKMMEKFVQEFRRAAKGSRYEGYSFIEEFKQEINEEI